MKLPEKISDIKFLVQYIGRTTPRFNHGQTYPIIYVYGPERGYKSSSLDYLLMEDGYRICPYEKRKFWKYYNVGPALGLRILYGRNYYIKDLLYAKNPFLAMLKDSPSFCPGAPYPLPEIK